MFYLSLQYDAGNIIRLLYDAKQRGLSYGVKFLALFLRRHPALFAK